MPTIAELQEKLKSVREDAAADVDSGPFASRTGRMSRRNAAAAEVPVVEALLREQVKRSAAAIFVGGAEDSVNEFATIAEEEGNAITVHAYSVYQKMASDMWPTLSGGAPTANNIPIFGAALQSMGELVGTFVRVNPSLMADLIGRRFADVTAFADTLREVIRAAVGTELEVAFIERTVTDAVLEGYEQNVVPVVVLGATASDPLLTNLFDGDCFYVEAMKDDEEKQVKSAMKSLKETFKAKFKKNNSHN